MGFLDWVYKKSNKKRTIIFNEKFFDEKIDFITLMRVRNEELIIEDSLNHISTFCNHIIVYDDSSEDNTFNILKKHKNVIAVVRNFNWKSGVQERLKCETEDRSIILNLAKKFNPSWIMYMDADERIVGDIKKFIESKESNDIDAVRISLFDAYMTLNDQESYKTGPLLGFRKYFGPERRDILMLWRNSEHINYQGLDSREPIVTGNKKIVTNFYCQHYGKSLSIEQWEQTCRYYIDYFPYLPYGEKWEKRVGKGVHQLSDFNTPLYLWGNELFNSAIKIHPLE